MSTALKLLEDALTDVIKRKDTAIQRRAKHEREVDNYDTVVRLLAEEEVELRKAVEAVSVIEPESAPCAPSWSSAMESGS